MVSIEIKFGGRFKKREAAEDLEASQEAKRPAQEVEPVSSRYALTVKEDQAGCKNSLGRIISTSISNEDPEYLRVTVILSPRRESSGTAAKSPGDCEAVKGCELPQSGSAQDNSVGQMEEEMDSSQLEFAPGYGAGGSDSAESARVEATSSVEVCPPAPPCCASVGDKADEAVVTGDPPAIL